MNGFRHTQDFTALLADCDATQSCTGARGRNFVYRALFYSWAVRCSKPRIPLTTIRWIVFGRGVADIHNSILIAVSVGSSACMDPR